MHDTPTQQFLGTMGYLSEIGMFLLLFLAFYFASEKKFATHKKLIRIMFAIQTILVMFMIGSFNFSYYGKNFTPHAIVGSIVYLIIAYTFLLMENKIPRDFQVPKKYRKLLMRVTMVLWAIAIFTGAYLYLTLVD